MLVVHIVVNSIHARNQQMQIFKIKFKNLKLVARRIGNSFWN